MKVAALLAARLLLEMWREPALLAVVLGIPGLFIVLIGAGYSSPLDAPLPVLFGGAEPAAAPIREALETATHPRGGAVFSVSDATGPEADDEALQAHTAVASVTAHPDRVVVRGDALNVQLTTAGSLVAGVLRARADREAGLAPAVRVRSGPVAEPAPRSEFEAYVPGMIVFGIMLLLAQTALIVGREVRQGTLRRMRVTRLRAWQFLAGVSLAQMAVAVVQVIVCFAIALAFGFEAHGSLLLALVIGLALSFSAIGGGLLVAGFVQNDSQAANVGGGLGVMLAMLSGALFPLPSEALFTLAGHEIGVFDVIPAAHGMHAFQAVLSYGAGFGDVAFRFGATVALSLVLFAVGVAVFDRRRWRSAR